MHLSITWQLGCTLANIHANTYHICLTRYVVLIERKKEAVSPDYVLV